ncbi:DUF4269 domain-containing protein [Spirosoma jeollabukense]
MNFDTIDYLNSGTPRQREVHRVLTEHQVLAKLDAFSPILVGTLPINIDIETSDLDIICYWTDRQTFTALVREKFSSEKGFRIRESLTPDREIVVANFNLEGFAIEIYGQNIPTRQQMGYRHMLIEYKLLSERGEAFRQEIIVLKRKGYKTEPAFGLLLGLQGNPYVALLAYEHDG